MAALLLTTKLHVPPARPDWVRRTRLLEQLDSGLRAGRKLTLVSAPPGFGKTTLLVSWLNPNAERRTLSNEAVDATVQRSSFSVQHFKTAWLSLDVADNDPARFLAYVIAALQTIVPELGQSALAALQAPPAPASADLVAALINEIDAIPEALILVLDDYHLIADQRIHDAVAVLLDHLPANLHLVIATRSDPPLPLARLRAHGQLTELRQRDLRFTSDEVAALVRQGSAIDLVPDDVVALTARAEGWIAGVQMALLALQGCVSSRGRQDPASLAAACTGSQHFILDYLTEEVFGRQTDDVCAFLLQTSILDQLCGSLCDAVLGAPPGSSQVMLEHLDHANLFIQPLDDQQLWYRYHRLFADLLRKRLQQRHADRVPVLHLRASAWLVQNGSTSEAIEHALAAHDPEQAADLIEQAAEPALMRSEIVTFLGWAGRLPEDTMRARPGLYILYILALLLNGDPMDAVASCLRDIDTSAPDIAGRALLVRANLAAFGGRFNETAELTRRALAQLPADDLFMRINAAWLQSNTVVAAGDLPAARRAFGELARASLQAGNVLIATGALCHLAEVHLRLAEPPKARLAYDRALAAATDARGQPMPIAGEALLGLGDVCREQNELDAALHHTLEGIELSRLWRGTNAALGYCTLARIRYAQGDARAAGEAMALAVQLVPQDDPDDLTGIGVGYYQALLAVQQGDLDAVSRWASERALDRAIDPAELDRQDDYLSYHVRKYEYLVLARLSLAQQRPERALAVVEPVLLRMERQGRTRLLIEALLLKALALQAQGALALAAPALERALRLAEPGGYVRLFVDEGEPMRRLLVQGGRSSTDRRLGRYRQRLLQAFPQAGTSVAAPAPESELQPLVERLSERELAVLRLLSAGRSNPEIARDLDVAVSTVRTHAKSIYGKLAAHGRWEAVQRARQLRLV